MQKKNVQRAKREALLPEDELLDYVKAVKMDFMDQKGDYTAIKQDIVPDPEKGGFRSELL